MGKTAFLSTRNCSCFFKPRSFGLLGVVIIQPQPAQNTEDKSPLDGSHNKASCQPLFEGFAKAGLTGSDLADLAGVSPPTVSKWRRGLIHIPPPRIAFLTLVLAHLLEDLRALRSLDAQLNERRSGWGEQAEIIEEVAGGLLKVQEQINLNIDPREVRLGAQMFREWWDSGAALNLQKTWLRAIGGRHPDEKSSHLIQTMDV